MHARTVEAASAGAQPAGGSCHPSITGQQHQLQATLLGPVQRRRKPPQLSGPADERLGRDPASHARQYGCGQRRWKRAATQAASSPCCGVRSPTLLASADPAIGAYPTAWFGRSCSSRCGLPAGRLPGMSPASHPADDQLDAATWCRHLIPDGSVYAFLADHRHQLFPPELFADVARQGGGHPSVPAEVIATVMVLQALEGLSDREAISALRRDIAWKVACGLRLDDEGLHPTVLVYWRGRIRASARPRRVFDAVRQVVEATGVLAGRRRRVVDATILEDAVATQDTVTQLVAAIRRVRRLVPQACKARVGAHDYDQPGKPECAWDDAQAKQALEEVPHGHHRRVRSAPAPAHLRLSGCGHRPGRSGSCRPSRPWAASVLPGPVRGAG